MKKLLSLIIIMSILIIPASIKSVFAENTFSITQDGITLTVTLDKESYKIGEEIKVTAEATTNRDGDTYFACSADYPDITIGIKHRNDGSSFFIDDYYNCYKYSGEWGSDPLIMTIIKQKGESIKKELTFSGKCFDSNLKAENLDYIFTPKEGIYQGEAWVDIAEGLDGLAGEHQRIKLTFPVIISADDPEEYDLYVSSATTSEANLTDGESTALNTVVRNLSDEDIEKEITVEFYMNGKLFDTVTEVANIEAGKFAVITSSKETELYFGTHTISTEVKISDDTAIDTDATNNKTKTRIKVLDE